MEKNENNSDKPKLIRFFVGITTVLVLLIWNFVKSENEIEHLTHAINSDLLSIEGVSTQLVSMYEREAEIVLTLNSQGLPSSVLSYKSEILQFVCNDKVLESHLDAGKRVNLNMSAYDREDYKNVNVKITKGRCEESA